MPVYMFTFHAYRSWMPDHPKGYTKSGIGVLPADLEMNEWYEERAHFSEITFDRSLQRVVVNAIKEVCVNKMYQLYYAVAVSTHAHAVVGWSEDTIIQTTVHDTLKRIIGLKLARHARVADRRWLSRGRDAKPVRTRKHFFHLVTNYLPDHRGVTFRMKGLPT